MVFAVKIFLIREVISKLFFRKIFNTIPIRADYKDFGLNMIFWERLIFCIILFILSWVKDASIFYIFLMIKWDFQHLTIKLNFHNLSFEINDVWNLWESFSDCHFWAVDCDCVTIIEYELELITEIIWLFRYSHNYKVINFNLDPIWRAFNKGERGFLYLCLWISNKVFCSIFKSNPLLRFLFNCNCVVVSFYYGEALLFLATK